MEKSSSLPTDSRTDPAVAPDTRQTIARAAIRLFAYNGFDGTSIRDIVEAAGVTKPVLYYYFSSKEALYRSLIDDIYARWMPKLEETLAQPVDFSVRLRNLLEYYFRCEDELEEHSIRLIYSAAFGPLKQSRLVNIFEYELRHIELLKEFFQEGIDKGYIQPGNVDAIVLHFFGSVMSYLNLRLVAGQEIDPAAYETILDLVMNGIGRRT
ncbi:MAG: TetR family transcriptional regulator [bacterium]|nr:TetR family transcriptional regulator [bacterium]